MATRPVSGRWSPAARPAWAKRPATNWAAAATRSPSWTSTAKPRNALPRTCAPTASKRSGVAADVTDRPAVEEAFAKVRTELGPVSILVTSAGLVDFSPFTEITPESWARHHRRQPDRHVPLLSGRAARHGRSRMGPHRDDLVVQRAARVPGDGSLRRVQGCGDLADEVAGARVRLGGHHGQQHPAVGHRDADAAPGRRPTATCRPTRQMAEQHPARATSAPATTSPRRSAFLCSEEAGFITGQVLGVNGGAVM